MNSSEALPGSPDRLDSWNRKLKGLISPLISTTFMTISLRFPLRLELGYGTCVFMFLQSWSNSEIELGLYREPNWSHFKSKSYASSFWFGLTIIMLLRPVFMIWSGWPISVSRMRLSELDKDSMNPLRLSGDMRGRHRSEPSILTEAAGVAVIAKRSREARNSLLVGVRRIELSIGGTSTLSSSLLDV